MCDPHHHYMVSFCRELLSDNPQYTMKPHASTYQKLSEPIESVLEEYENFVLIQLHAELFWKISLYVPNIDQW